MVSSKALWIKDIRAVDYDEAKILQEKDSIMTKSNAVTLSEHVQDQKLCQKIFVLTNYLFLSLTDNDFKKVCKKY